MTPDLKVIGIASAIRWAALIGLALYGLLFVKEPVRKYTYCASKDYLNSEAEVIFANLTGVYVMHILFICQAFLVLAASFIIGGIAGFLMDL